MLPCISVLGHGVLKSYGIVVKMNSSISGKMLYGRWIPFAVLAVGFGSAAVASPFWYGDAAPATNRVAASCGDAIGTTALESRRFSEAWSEETTFTTYPRGFMAVIR